MWPFNKKAEAESVQTVEGAVSSLQTLREFSEHMNAIREEEKTRKDIDKGIDEITGTDYRVMTIQDWLWAMKAADVPWNQSFQPSWVKLFDIYQNMMQDSHIRGVVDTLDEGVKSKDFYISDETGERLDEVTELFKSKWFYDFMTIVLNAKLYGFSLTQLQDFRGEDLHITAREVNRKHVRPDLGGIVKQQYDQKIIASWDKMPYKNWTIFIYEKNLGKLNSCVRWWIYKTEISRFWAKYNQTYGIPPIIVKTSLKDTKRKENAISMVKKWLHSKWMVIDMDEELVPFNTTGSSQGQQFFENMIRLADEQISKALIGSTMVLDDGSSRSQSEVHESNTKNFINSVCRLVKFTTDKELIPKLREIGFPIPEGAKFHWDNSEKLTMKERADVVNILANKYKIDIGVASEFVGIELQEKEIEPLYQNPNFGGNGQ